MRCLPPIYDSFSITDWATTTEFVTYVKEQSELGDQLSDKKMFGEIACYGCRLTRTQS